MARTEDWTTSLDDYLQELATKSAVVRPRPAQRAGFAARFKEKAPLPNAVALPNVNFKTHVSQPFLTQCPI